MFPFTDWLGTFYPATLALLNGASLDQLGFFNPTYALAPLIPFALLGQDMSIVYVLVSILAFILIGLRLSSHWQSVLLILLSPFVFASILFGNVEWLVLLGLIMPKPIGIVFLLIKPQMTILLVLYWMYQAYSQRQLTKLVAPTIFALGFSFLLEPSYITRMLSYSILHVPFANISLFPYGLVISIVLLFIAWRQHKGDSLLSASAFAMPYYTLSAWSIVAFQFVKNKRLALLSLGLQWFIVTRI